MFNGEANLKMLSPTGTCKMWDASADGYARGEGCGSVMLKLLEDAIRDGDRIESVIRETGVNSDGRTMGITMPSASSQEKLIKETYRRAGLDPSKESDRYVFHLYHLSMYENLMITGVNFSKRMEQEPWRVIVRKQRLLVERLISTKRPI